MHWARCVYIENTQHAAHTQRIYTHRKQIAYALSTCIAYTVNIISRHKNKVFGGCGQLIPFK